MKYLFRRRTNKKEALLFLSLWHQIDYIQRFSNRDHDSKPLWRLLIKKSCEVKMELKRIHRFFKVAQRITICCLRTEVIIFDVPSLFCVILQRLSVWRLLILLISKQCFITLKHICNRLLPPANEDWGKVMFLHCLSTGRGCYDVTSCYGQHPPPGQHPLLKTIPPA